MTSPSRDTVVATMRKHRICVLIPTYNNAQTLHRLVGEVLQYAADVVVVNDGSTDDTLAILHRFGDAIRVVTYGKNRGKGYALKRGFQEALRLGYAYAITLDSDGQHYPKEIPTFVRTIVEHPGSLIVGERDLSNVDINSQSAFANKFSNFWFNIQTGYRLNDTQTGYRAYPLKRLYGRSLLTNRYEAELELLVFAAWNGVPIHPISIDVFYPPQAERITHFKPVKDFTRISILNTILCIGAMVYGLPVRCFKALTQKRLFAGEFTLFTRRKGFPREAALTLGRVRRSLQALLFFLFSTPLVFTPFTFFFFKIGKKTEAKKLRYHRILQGVARFLTRHFPGAKTRYENLGQEDFATPALIVCNHQSHLDLPVLMATHPKLIFLTNDWVWNNPFYGHIIRQAEYLPVTAGVETIMPQLRDLTARGYSIVVFPEGTRSADCSILRFHQGAFWMAEELGVDIVPMVLHGVGHYLPKNDFMLRRGQLSLCVLPRVPRATYAGLALRERAKHFRQLIRTEYDRMAKENETAAYFHPWVLYRYAYRGWATVARCKKSLKAVRPYHHLIDGGTSARRVHIRNSGIGVFALLYAWVNKETEVYAYESCLADHQVAASTAALPPNLHFVHTVWETSEAMSEEDLTIVLGAEEQAVGHETPESTIYLPFQS